MLTPADRELVGIGASIGAGCHSCLEFHLDAGSRAGLGQESLLKAIEDAECVRRSASGQLSALGRRSLGMAAELPADCCDTSDRAKELAAIGAAVAANSRANLEKHIAAATLVGVSARELDEAVRLARAVQRRSEEILAEEATRLLARPEPVVAEPAPVSPGCGPDCGCGGTAAASVLPVVEAAAVSGACGPDCGCGDASVAIALPVVEAAAASGGCGPDCGCGSGASEGSAAPVLVAAAVAAPAATSAACDCGCN